MMTQNTDLKAVANLSTESEPDAFSKDYWTIGDMARHFEVSLRTLRFYEDRGMISPLRHGSTRFYGAECRRRVNSILRAKKLGFTLSRINSMLQTGGELVIAETLAPGEIVAQISALERQKADLDQAIMDLRAAHARFPGEPQKLAHAS
jgi:DNA-binding transcriptional MerR regulator